MSNILQIVTIGEILHGSVIGPSIFLIYIHNIDNNINSSIPKFTDDKIDF